MFRKILIANRGEIALRILCACKELGIQTVAVYSEADRNSLHVRFADEAICIGPPRSSESYLNIPQVISAAEITNVDAIHPGYGFLSENANFAEVCEASHITFIGPSPDVIRMMGEKDRARAEMAAAGLADHSRQRRRRAGRRRPPKKSPRKSASRHDQGCRRRRRPRMRVVRDKSRADRRVSDRAHRSRAGLRQPQCLHREIDRASAPHRVSGAGRPPRQRDPSGRARMLAPAPPPESARGIAVAGARRGDAQAHRQQVVDALRKIGYSSAGTVEFLRDESGKLYFIEMNARIQVEHPVTEMVTGVDLVKSQIRIAAGEKLEDVVGQCRIPRPRHRMPHQRRRSRYLRAVPGPHHRVPRSGRPGNSRGHRRLRRRA